MRKLFVALVILMILSGFAMMSAGAPFWFCAWLESFEYGVIGLLIWLAVQPGSGMSLPRALFLWAPAMGMKRMSWLKKGGW